MYFKSTYSKKRIDYNFDLDFAWLKQYFSYVWQIFYLSGSMRALPEILKVKTPKSKSKVKLFIFIQPDLI